MAKQVLVRRKGHKRKKSSMNQVKGPVVKLLPHKSTNPAAQVFEI